LPFVPKPRITIDADRIGGAILGFMSIALVIVILALIFYHGDASKLSYVNGGLGQ
jgi:hypothetical protein